MTWTRTRSVRWTTGWLVAAALASTTVGVPPAAATELFYWHLGDRIDLDVVPGAWTIGLRHGAPSPSKTSLFGDAPHDDVTLTAVTGDIWSLTTGTPIDGSRSGSPGAIRDTIRDALRAAPEVEWAYPVLRVEGGGEVVLPTPAIVLRAAIDVDEPRLQRWLPRGVRLERRLRVAGDTFRVRLDDPWTSDPIDVANELDELPWVEWAAPDFLLEVRSTAFPNDPAAPEQWHLRNDGTSGSPPGIAGADARLERAWDAVTGDDSVVIAILDDGVELDHPDLRDRIFENPGEIPGNGADDDGNGYSDDVNGWDFADHDADPNPRLDGPASHGVGVAGVAGATGDNGIGVAGACWSCRILPVRIPISGQVAPSTDFAEAIAYAGQFADVINGSWRTAPSPVVTTALRDVVTTAREGLGAPAIFAAGNSASGSIPVTTPELAAGTYFYVWVFHKDAAGSAGSDTAWLDSVVFPDGSVEDFSDCQASLESWDFGGDAEWRAVSDVEHCDTSRGLGCCLQAGTIGDGQATSATIVKTSATAGALSFRIWPSAERNTPSGEGDIVLDDDSGPPECRDGVTLVVFDQDLEAVLGGTWCGTSSTQCSESGCWPLEHGTLAYPASLAETIAVGAATNFDQRSDYSQWGQALDFVAHSSGGSVGIHTLDVSGANGASAGDEQTDFGGTSSAAPLASGIASLLLTREPGLSADEVRQRLRSATRKIGPIPFIDGRNDYVGHGALSAEILLSEPTLTVSMAGAGSGTVTSQPGGLACGTTCSATFLFATEVALDATPTAGSTFSGWSGDPDCDDGMVRLERDTHCVATFAEPPPGCLPDDLEPDDEPALASTIASGVAQTHSLCTAGDEDWVTFTLGPEVGETWSVQIRTSGPGDDDTVVWLYDGLLELVEVDDDDGRDRFSAIDRDCGSGALPSGTYFVRIEEYNDDDAIDSYRLDATYSGCSDSIFRDGFESGNIAAWTTAR